MSILNDQGTIREEVVEELRKCADYLDCQCPTKLLDLLQEIRGFRQYTNACITKYPKDAPTHEWLTQSADNLDSLLSKTIVQLARMEGFVDEDNIIVARTTRSS